MCWDVLDGREDPGYRRHVAVPDFQSFLLPLLKLASDGSEHSIADALDNMAQAFQLSDEDRTELLPSGKQPRINNRIGWALTYLRKAGLLSTVRRGSFQLTERGRQLLAEAPARIDLKFLQSRFSEIVEFRREEEDAPAEFSVNDGTWNSRPGVEERIRERFERLIPDAATRLGALGLFAFAIENADEERSDAWYVRETATGLRLMTGGLLACEVARKKVKLSVVGPISDEARAALGSDSEDDSEFQVIPGGVILTFPAERAAEATSEIKDSLNNFVDLAMARVRRTSGLDDHAPEAVAYVSSLVGRELPQPEPTADDLGEGEDDGANDAEMAREPRIRGRMQMFERGERTIGSLMSDIEREVIALPDLQRPFVWEDTKVRDLLDSLFLGFPVGTLVLWHIASEKEARNIGTEKQSRQATTLIIDGQQRLTSLAAVIGGVDVVGKDERKRKITIGFRPRDGRFEVADAAIHSDPEFVPNVTELWTGARQNSQIRRELINKLRDKGRVVNEAYEDAVERNLEIARAITSYRFPTIEIRESANAGSSEEDIAEIFVRLNNQGTRLGQADFVLTLLSVFHGPLRDQIEARAREMSKDGLIGIDTQQLLRAACGVAFDRARMAAVYRYLRGVDPITGEADPAGRRERLDRLDVAAKSCMDPVPWRDFLLCVRHAGFINPSLISSKNAIVNAYALYIRGLRVGVPKAKLDELITRWVFVTLLTGRYSGSSESMFEQDLARVSGLDPKDFVRVLDEALGKTVTGDYWTHSLVSALTTQKLKTSAALAFRASQVVLGSRALFSDAMLREVMDPAAGTAGVIHLFAPARLNSNAVGERRRQNQVANVADVGRLEIRPSVGQSPLKYVSKVRAQLHIDDNKWGRMCAEHALPINWESMAFDDFLVARRGRMADIIRTAFRKLGGEADAPSLTPPWFLPGAEEVWRNIAETERALRGVVRDVYLARFPQAAATKIEEALPEQAREALGRALRGRPAGADPLSVVDYLYLGQLSPLLFPNDIWQEARPRLGGAADVKKQLLAAIDNIAPVRNEIAHVREVEHDRLLRANLACKDVLAMIRGGASR